MSAGLFGSGPQGQYCQNEESGQRGQTDSFAQLKGWGNVAQFYFVFAAGYGQAPQGQIDASDCFRPAVYGSLPILVVGVADNQIGVLSAGRVSG